MLLAGHAGEPHLFGWYVGLGIGFAVVTIVVVLVATIMSLASRISKQAQQATEALDVGRANTLPIWDLQKTNNSAKAILLAAQTARKALEGR